MELSEFGYCIISFIGGSGFGMMAMGYIAYTTGLKTKQKTRLDIVEERLIEIEGILRK
jgi:hypothetical protein